MKISVPSPLAVHDFVTSDGAHIRLRQHGDAAGPRVFLSHGNGFATNAYYPFWRLLEDKFELIVYDQRNHGENPYAGSFGHHIDGFRDDLQQVLEQTTVAFGAKPAHGAFHSVSGVAALAHALKFDWPWEKLVLFDPPLVPSAEEDLHAQAFASERFLANWALERPNTFGSPDELAAQLASVRGMKDWTPGSHELMAHAVLRESDGAFELACPRELEAGVYLGNAHAPIWHALDTLSAHKDRLLIISADPARSDARYPPLSAARLAKRFGFDVVPVSDTTHMLQLEQPDACARLTREFFG